MFPHSMEFSYLPLSALVKGENNYDWPVVYKVLTEEGECIKTFTGENLLKGVIYENEFGAFRVILVIISLLFGVLI